MCGAGFVSVIGSVVTVLGTMETGFVGPLECIRPAQNERKFLALDRPGIVARHGGLLTRDAEHLPNGRSHFGSVMAAERVGIDAEVA